MRAVAWLVGYRIRTDSTRKEPQWTSPTRPFFSTWISDQLIEHASKDLIAETARVLALMVAGYQAKFGEIPVAESLSLLRIEKLTEERALAQRAIRD